MMEFYSYQANKLRLIKIDTENMKAELIIFESDKPDYSTSIPYAEALKILATKEFKEKKLDE